MASRTYTTEPAAELQSELKCVAYYSIMKKRCVKNVSNVGGTGEQNDWSCERGLGEL